MHIAIGHYGVGKDISGVTTWLSGLIAAAHSKGHTLDLMIHHLGMDPLEGSFLKENRALSRIRSVKAKPRWTEDEIRQTIDFLNFARPQIFLPQCLAGMHFAANYAEKYGLPWVLTVHSDDPAYWGLLEECAPRSSIGKVVVVSDYLNSEVRRRGLAADPITIPCGVTAPAVQARFSRTPFRVVFSGRVIEEQKRISLVLQAMGKACEADSEIECLILGDGSAFESSQRWVREQGLSARIQFAGSLKQEDVIRQLGSCQAFLLMSDFEGLPVSLLEAMASGLVPVVRSIRSGVSQVVISGETGLLTSDDPAEAANAILTLAKDADRWTRLSVNARALVLRDYEAGSCYRKWLTLLDELAAGGTAKFPMPNPKRVRLPVVNPKLTRLDERRPKRLAWIPFVLASMRRKIRGRQNARLRARGNG